MPKNDQDSPYRPPSRRDTQPTNTTNNGTKSTVLFSSAGLLGSSLNTTGHQKKRPRETSEQLDSFYLMNELKEMERELKVQRIMTAQLLTEMGNLKNEKEKEILLLRDQVFKEREISKEYLEEIDSLSYKHDCLVMESTRDRYLINEYLHCNPKNPLFK